MIRIKVSKKLVSVSLLSALTMSAETAVAKYIPYQGPKAAPAPEPVETTQQVPKKPVGKHVVQSLEHATSASIHGEAGHGSVLIEHARLALVHAQAAEQELEGKSKTHMSQAVEHLKEGIKHGEMNHGDMALGHVKEAVPHIKASLSE